MSKHIVIDARDYSSTTGRYIRSIISNLEKIDNKNNYTILVLPKSDADYIPKAKNFKKKLAPFNKFSLSEQVKFGAFLKQLRPDLVHFASTTQPIFYNKLKVTTIHDLTPLRFNLAVGKLSRITYPLKKKLLNLMLYRAGKKSAIVFTGTDYVKQDLINNLGVSASKIVVTSESADAIKEIPKKINQLYKKPFIFYVGRAQAHKNINGLLLAFKKIQQNNSKVMLVLAGKKDLAYQHIENLVKKQNIHNVVFTDYVSEGQLHWLYKNCLAYVFPSFSEGFGLPGLEAMVHGAPLVSSNATCLPEVYKDSALYFNPNNVNDIALKIDRIIRDNQLRNTLIVKGKKHVLLYSWTQSSKQVLNEYNKLLKI